MKTDNLRPSRDLYLSVRAGFIAKDSTLTAWCREHGVNPTNARSALVGAWNGPKGRALRAKLLNDSGVTGPSSAAA